MNRDQRFSKNFLEQNLNQYFSGQSGSNPGNLKDSKRQMQSGYEFQQNSAGNNYDRSAPLLSSNFGKNFSPGNYEEKALFTRREKKNTVNSNDTYQKRHNGNNTEDWRASKNQGYQDTNPVNFQQNSNYYSNNVTSRPAVQYGTNAQHNENNYQNLNSRNDFINRDRFCNIKSQQVNRYGDFERSSNNSDFNANPPEIASNYSSNELYFGTINPNLALSNFSTQETTLNVNKSNNWQSSNDNRAAANNKAQAFKAQTFKAQPSKAQTSKITSSFNKTRKDKKRKPSKRKNKKSKRSKDQRITQIKVETIPEISKGEVQNVPKGKTKADPQKYWSKWWATYGYIEKSLPTFDESTLKSIESTFTYREDRRDILLRLGTAKIRRTMNISELNYLARDVFKLFLYRKQLQCPIFIKSLSAKESECVKNSLNHLKNKPKLALLLQSMIYKWHAASEVIKRIEAGEDIPGRHAQNIMADKRFHYTVMECIKELKTLCSQEWSGFEEFYNSL